MKDKNTSILFAFKKVEKRKNDDGLRDRSENTFL